MPGRVELAAGAHVLDRLELEAAGEDREPPEQRPLVRVEQVVAPLERRGQRLLARRRRVAPAAEHAEAIVEPLGDRRRAQRSDAARGELERERQAVEAEADAGDVHRVLAHRARSPAPPRPPARRTAARPRSRRSSLRLERLLGIGDVERRNPEHDLARHAQRLAARREDRQLRRRAQQGVDERRASPRADARSCPGRAAASAARGSSTTASTSVCPGSARTSSAAATASGTSRGVGERGELDERRAVRVRRLGGAGQLEREPRLADPAGPGEREQARSAQQRLQLGELAVAPDERARVRRQRRRRMRPRPSRARRAPPRAPRPAPRARRAAPAAQSS